MCGTWRGRGRMERYWERKTGEDRDRGIERKNIYARENGGNTYYTLSVLGLVEYAIYIVQ